MSKEKDERTLTFSFGDNSTKHTIGDVDCNNGWCGMGFPRQCKCGGLIHANFGDENGDGDYWLYQSCDTCKENYDEV